MSRKLTHTVLLALMILTATTAFAGGDAPHPLTELASEMRTRPTSELSPVEHQLFIYEREILQQFFHGDLDEVMDLFLAEDAMVFPPGMNYIAGREPQKAMFKELLSTEGFELDWEPIDAHVSASEDMGYVYGLVRWKAPDGPRKLGKYISVWEKIDGRWMNKMEIRNLIRVEG